ncbi:hypothetical protein FORC087_561 (plasmid) [Bacillus cereus]|nr:hypothetical protein FORC087_561 [Bacillus cereus]
MFFRSLCGSRDIAGLCGDIWAWLDRAWSCDIGGYTDIYMYWNEWKANDGPMLREDDMRGMGMAAAPPT